MTIDVKPAGSTWAQGAIRIPDIFGDCHNLSLKMGLWHFFSPKSMTLYGWLLTRLPWADTFIEEHSRIGAGQTGL